MLAETLLLCTDELLDRGSRHEDLYLLPAEAVLSGAILVDVVGIAHDRSTILNDPIDRYTLTTESECESFICMATVLGSDPSLVG
jgi:hypothetical protein